MKEGHHLKLVRLMVPDNRAEFLKNGRHEVSTNQIGFYKYPFLAKWFGAGG